MADDTRTFEEIKAEQDRLWAEAAAQPEPEGYDAWFREQVEEGLREAADPNTRWVTQEEVRANMLQQHERWKQLEKKSA
jgi:hypothetical protein